MEEETLCLREPVYASKINSINRVYQKYGVLIINRAAILDNVKRIHELTNKRIIAVVKENGYGVGLYNSYLILRQAGIDFFAVSVPAEAFALRQYGWAGDILLMSPVMETDKCVPLIEENISMAVCSKGQLEIIKESAYICGKNPRLHLKFDCGFGRYGFGSDDVEFLKENLNCSNIEGCYTHFSVYKGSGLKRQLQKFRAFVDAMWPDGNHPLLHGANSGTLVESGDLGLDAVRIGSLLLGRGKVKKGFKNAVRLEAPIIYTKYLHKGDTIGYGADYCCKGDTKIGIVPVGRGDGLSDVSIKGIKNLFYTFSKQQYINRIICSGISLKVLGKIGIGHIVLNLTDTGIGCGDRVYIDVNPLYVHPVIDRSLI